MAQGCTDELMPLRKESSRIRSRTLKPICGHPIGHRVNLGCTARSSGCVPSRMRRKKAAVEMFMSQARNLQLAVVGPKKTVR